MKILISISLVLLIGTASAQTAEEMQYAAYLKASKSMWEQSIQLTKDQSDFTQALAMYGLLNNTMASKDEDTFDDNVDQTIELLKSVIEENPEWGEPKAVLSSVYGLVMAYSPMKGMLYGSRSSSLIDNAMKEQEDSPMVQKLYGGSKLYTPEMFGGSPERAVEAFEKSVELYEKSNSTENWMYLDTLVGLSFAYSKTGKEELAKQTLEKAIGLEPQYQWAKSILASLNK